MKYFRRVLTLLRPQYKSVIIVFICAFLAAGLFSLNIVAMLPMLKVMTREEGLHGWVHRAVVKDRFGLTFNPQRQLEDFSKSEEQRSPTPLQVIKINDEDFAESALHIALDDIVIKAWQTGPEPAENMLHGQLLKTLALARTGQPVNLIIKHLDESLSSTTLTPEKIPFYATPSYQLLKLIPAESDPTFRRQAIVMVILLMLGLTFFPVCHSFLSSNTSSKK